MARLLLITPPAAEPVTVAEANMNSHITHSVEDTLMEKWITAGRELAEIYLRRSLINQTWELSYDHFPRMPIALPRSPVSSITSITYYDYEDTATVISSDNYQLDVSASPARVGLTYGYTWPSVTLRSIDSVKIRYVAGYGAAGTSVPSVINDAIILYCTHRSENRSGEAEEAPKQFYNTLRPKRLHL